jgi:hypothetical protein
MVMHAAMLQDGGAGLTQLSENRKVKELLRTDCGG